MAAGASTRWSGTTGRAASRDDTGVRAILGIDVHPLSEMRAIERIAEAVRKPGLTRIAFLNAHGANIAFRDRAFRDVLADFTVLPDGLGVDLCSRMHHGAPFPDNLNGTDFIPRLFDGIGRPCRVALFGATPGIAREVARVWQARWPDHRFVALADGYEFDEARLLETLRQDPADILLVALGNPAQEKWIAGRIGPEHARVAIGVGALFDFAAGRVPRAPGWMIGLRLEWLHRLWLEPARMWRRYLLGNPLFMLRVLRSRPARR